jgi:hypothetical protein
MPNTFIDNRDAWIRMSDIDYLGQFVKVWLAFNAWYRSAYTASRDRDIIDEIKWQGNPVLSKLRPMLEAASDDAAQFRAEIGLLHDRLTGFELFGGKGDKRQRITLCSIYLKDNPPVTRATNYYGYEFHVERLANKQVKIQVKRTSGASIVLQQTQTAFNLSELEAFPDFSQRLSAPQQGVLRQLYAQVSPTWIEDLTTYQDNSPSTAEIKCGAFSFRCGKDALFAGMTEVLYQMRCTLFHGELAPTREAVACYEPAYRLVRRFIESVS